MVKLGLLWKNCSFLFWTKPTLLHSFYTVLPIFDFTMLPTAQFSAAKVWLWIIKNSGGEIVIYNPTKNPIKLEENRCSPTVKCLVKSTTLLHALTERMSRDVYFFLLGRRRGWGGGIGRWGSAGGMIGCGEGVVYIPGRPTDTGLQLGKTCYPYSR